MNPFLAALTIEALSPLAKDAVKALWEIFLGSDELEDEFDVEEVRDNWHTEYLSLKEDFDALAEELAEVVAERDALLLQRDSVGQSNMHTHRVLQGVRAAAEQLYAALYGQPRG